jgi:alkylation response protein AidB-like acyl-CoA dehydrogenase
MKMLLQGDLRDWLRANAPLGALTFAERVTWHRTLFDAGLIGLTWPKEFGGQGREPASQAHLLSELALIDAPAFVNQAGLEIAGPSLMQFGTPEQQARYLRSILTGEELWCQLYSEPEAGSDLASLRCRAQRDGDTFILNGQKVWTSEAGWSDFGVLLARTEPDAPKHKGISCFILDMKTTGIDVRPLTQITGSEHFSEVFLTDVRVPVANLIGPLNGGWSVAMHALDFERAGNSLARIVRYQTAWRKLCRVVAQIEFRGQPLIEHSSTREKLGCAWAEIETQRLTALRLLEMLDAGEPLGSLPSMHKLAYSEFERRYADMAQEILGPWGLVSEGSEYTDLMIGTSSGEAGAWPHEAMWARAVTIFAGTSEIQKNIIADRELALPREPRP